ncbi:unnamed protein product, partial [Mesorhabditis belari]
TAKQSVHRDAIIELHKRAVSTFKSLNCALCSMPYSKTANEVNTPTQKDMQFGKKMSLKCSTDLFNDMLIGGDVCPTFNTYIGCRAPYYQKGCNDFNAGVFFCNTDRVAVNAYNGTCDTKGLLKQCPPYR